MRDLIEALNRAHELDNPRSLHEASKTIDTEGLQKNLPVVIKDVLSKLPHKLHFQRLTGRIEKFTRPVSYAFMGKVYVEGESVQSTSGYNTKEGVTEIHLSLYKLPTNCELTVEVLKTAYEEKIMEFLSNSFTSSDDFTDRGAQYQSLEQQLKNAVNPLESKYHVTLNARFHPDIDTFQRRGGPLTAYVRVTGVEGKLGQLRKGDSSFWDYVVDGKEYSGVVDNYHSLLPSKDMAPENVDFEWIVAETEKGLVKFLEEVDSADYLIKNEGMAEKNMNSFITNLAHRYPDAKLTVTRGNWHTFPPFIVSYDNGSNSWEMRFSVSEVVYSFENVKKRIQQKIYRTGKTKSKSSYASAPTELNFESVDVFEAMKIADKLDEARRPQYKDFRASGRGRVRDIQELVVYKFTDVCRNAAEAVNSIEPNIDIETLANNLLQRAVASFTSAAKKDNSITAEYPLMDDCWKFDYLDKSWHIVRVVKTKPGAVYVEIEVCMQNCYFSRGYCVYERSTNTFRLASVGEFNGKRSQDTVKYFNDDGTLK